jgi:hypothetical protein
MDPKSPQKEGPYAMWVILAGLAAMSAVTIGALIRYPNPTAIVTALGPVTGVIGTLVGAYFGMRGSSLAQQNANAGEVARINATASASEPATGGYPAAPAAQYDASSNGNGNGNGTMTASIVEQFRAQDGASDVGETDDEDPASMPADNPPDDEGDDRAAHGVTP